MTGRCTGGQHHPPTTGGHCPCGAVSRHPVAVARKPGTVALAWHDVVCPEAQDCRDRPLHAASQTIVNGGIVDRFLDRLAALDGPS